jgi:phosphoserine aminotransferase
VRRVDNFNAGPAALPLPALERAQRELIDFEGTGMSIMEHSHRGKAYEKVHNEAIALLRELLGDPRGLRRPVPAGRREPAVRDRPDEPPAAGKSADYVITGGWSEKAYEEPKWFGKARVAATTATEGTAKFTRVPKPSELELDPDGGIRPHDVEQHALRDAVALPRHGRGPARRRHVERLPVEARSTSQVRR